MGVVELFFIAVGLSMDAFAVAICKGLAMPRLDVRQASVIALFFGGFQAAMPIMGWLLGAQFASVVEPVDHWIAFALLVFIGAKMLVDALREGGEGGEGGEGSVDAPSAVAAVPPPEGPGAPGAQAPRTAGPLDLRELLMLAVATSIDALAVGISLAFLQVDIVAAASFIGATTFALSFAGVALGHQFGRRWEKPSTIVGGVVLILIGTKILLEHLGLV